MSQKEKITQNKKALHLAAMAIILVALIITITGIVVIWSSIQTKAGHTIQIQNVNFQPATTIIYVQNTGQGTVNIKTVQIDNEQHQINSANCTVNSENTTTIPEGSTAEITINKQYTTIVHIKAICEDGTAYEADYAPRT
jgi:biopolymer transport protein ExbD